MKRGPGNPNWRKGQSGNPGGRPKGYAEFLDACREHTPEALATILGLMAGAQAEAVKLNAAQYLIDRGWGKAPQAQTGEGGEGPAELLVRWLTTNSKS